MGRGRAKAKQTKVARDLKYSSPRLDADALQREIGTSGTAVQDEPDEEYDPYDRYAPADDEDDDERTPGYSQRR